MEIAKTKLGRTAVEISRLGFGTAPLGNMYSDIPEEKALDTVRTALNSGIRFIDTAPYYGAGLSERRVGGVANEFGRNNLVLSTKVGRLIKDDGAIVFDFSRDGVLRSIEASLERLKVDYIDILLVHDPDDHYKQALNEAFPTLAELRSQKVIKAIGAGMNQWEMLRDFTLHADPDCFLLAGRYTLLEQTAMDEFLPLCQSRNIGIFLGGVFNSGILAGSIQKYNYADAPPEIIEKVRRLEVVCLRHNVPLRVAALHFALTHPAVNGVVLGAQTAEEVSQNVGAFHQTIPSALWQELKAGGLLRADAPVPQG
jgi:D-threo-aldose 1-dehydrogenase